MSSLKALTKHQQCGGCTRVRGKKASAAAAAVMEANVVTEPEPEPPSIPPPVEKESDLPLGYGWKSLRKHVIEEVGKRARAILEQQFQRGQLKGGDRRSCFEMQETLAGRLPVEERVSWPTIQNWLSARIQREKDNSNPQIVRKRAVVAEQKKLLIEAWGFDSLSMTKTEITNKLAQKFMCTVKSRKNPTGEFK